MSRARHDRLLAMLVALGGCTAPAAAPIPDPDADAEALMIAAAGTSAGLDLLPAIDGGTPEAVHHRSVRCRSCHLRQRDEWALSAHAGSARGAYQTALTHVPEAKRAECAGCHVPLSAASASIAEEGVACDACHTAVGPKPAPLALELKPELATKFGPYKDSKDHNFHKVAYSDFVVGSSLCVSCHDDRGTQAQGAFPILTSAKEWRSGKKSGESCQSCHMPTSRAKACKAADQIRTVYAHDFGGRDKAASLGKTVAITLARKDGAVEASVSHGAGHSLPTDLPERRMRLVLEALDAKGAAVARKERVFGRTLVDAAGAPAPFFAAVKQTKDDRIPQAAARTETVAVAGATRVRARLYYEAWDRSFEKWYGTAPEPVLVAERGMDVR